jgi:hypothetical protein
MQIHNLCKFEPAGQTAYCIGFLAMPKNRNLQGMAKRNIINHFRQFCAV